MTSDAAIAPSTLDASRSAAAIPFSFARPRATGSSLPSSAARYASSGSAASDGIRSASAPPTSPPTM